MEGAGAREEDYHHLYYSKQLLNSALLASLESCVSVSRNASSKYLVSATSEILLKFLS